MDFSMRLFVVASLLLFASMATGSDRPLVINDVKDEVCDLKLCDEACKSVGKLGCCAGYPGSCICGDTKACPFYVTVEIAENEDVAIKKSIA